MVGIFLSPTFADSSVVATSYVDRPINFGSAHTYVVLAGTSVSSTDVAGTVVNGYLGVFPGTEVTGFPPAVLNGQADKGNGAAGNAMGAFITAYGALSAKPVTSILKCEDLGGRTLSPGVYQLDCNATLNGQLTLAALGNPFAVWTFHISKSLSVGQASSVVFLDGIGNPEYVYWQVGTSATLAKGVSLAGSILATGSITLGRQARVTGRLFSLGGSVNLDQNTVVIPASSSLAFLILDLIASANSAWYPSSSGNGYPIFPVAPVQPTFNTAVPSAAPTTSPYMFTEPPLDLGAASTYAILGGSAITCSAALGSVVTGNLGLYPGTAVTGFPASVLHGQLEIANTAALTAQTALAAAYAVAAAKPATTTHLAAIELAGMTLAPGVYKYGAAATLTGTLTLDAGGNPFAVWTFQVGSALTSAAGGSVVFKDGIGNPEYVYWVVGSSAAFAAGSTVVGNVLATASIALASGVKVRGRLLALGAAVTLDYNIVTIPSTASASVPARRMLSAQTEASAVQDESLPTFEGINIVTCKIMALVGAVASILLRNLICAQKMITKIAGGNAHADHLDFIV